MPIKTKYEVERIWTHRGFRCVAIRTERGHRCGYVGMRKDHPGFGQDYTAKVFYPIECHGGLTYSGPGDGYPINGRELHWIGFDCHHYGDAEDLDWVARRDPKLAEYLREWFGGGVIRSLSYCIRECESIAKQLEEIR